VIDIVTFKWKPKNDFRNLYTAEHVNRLVFVLFSAADLAAFRAAASELQLEHGD